MSLEQNIEIKIRSSFFRIDKSGEHYFGSVYVEDKNRLHIVFTEIYHEWIICSGEFSNFINVPDKFDIHCYIAIGKEWLSFASSIYLEWNRIHQNGNDEVFHCIAIILYANHLFYYRGNLLCYLALKALFSSSAVPCIYRKTSVVLRVALSFSGIFQFYRVVFYILSFFMQMTASQRSFFKDSYARKTFVLTWNLRLSMTNQKIKKVVRPFYLYFNIGAHASGTWY